MGLSQGRRSLQARVVQMCDVGTWWGHRVATAPPTPPAPPSVNAPRNQAAALTNTRVLLNSMTQLARPSHTHSKLSFAHFVHAILQECHDRKRVVGYVHCIDPVSVDAFSKHYEEGSLIIVREK